MYGIMSLEVIERREAMLREAEPNHLKKSLRANRKKSAVSRRISTVAWELSRIGGLLRKLLRRPGRAGQNRDGT